MKVFIKAKWSNRLYPLYSGNLSALSKIILCCLCPIIKLVLVWNFYPPAWPAIVNRWLLRSIRIARIARPRQQWHDLANHDITLNRRKKKNSKTRQKKKWRDEEKRKKICSEHLQSFVSRFLARARERFARNGYVLAHPSSRGNYFLLRVFLSLLVVFSIAKLLEPSLAFACSIMAFSRNESSRIFVEHALHFARIQFRTQAIVLGTKGSVISISLTINECWRTWKTSLTREKQDWPSRSSGCGDFKGLTRFVKSLLDFLSSPQSGRRQKLGVVLAGCIWRYREKLLKQIGKQDPHYFGDTIK